MNDKDLHERLRSARWPDPSSGLRARIAAIPVRPPAIALADRVWYSRGWRIGVAATAVAIIALDMWGAPANLRPVQSTTTAGETQEIADLIESVGIPAEAAVSIARRSAPTVGQATVNLTPLLIGDVR